MHRSLRFQLIASVLVTVAIALGASQWLGTHLSERALERDLRDSTVLVVETVTSLWENGDLEQLRRELATLVGGMRWISAIDVFLLREGRWETVATTRRTADVPTPVFRREDETGRVLAEAPVTDALRGGGVWRVVVPVRRADGADGAVQVEVHPAALSRLKRSLRLIDLVFLLLSTSLISVLLVFLLEHRVTRPVAALVGGMRRAETGDLDVRVSIPGGGEFEFLAHSFNSMLSRIEALTSHLEARIERATKDLAAKNRELQTANEKLSEAQLDVARAERLAAHGHMATSIAHELGTPLNSVLGYTQLLLRDESVPERIAKLSVIESQVRRMADTIRGVLDQARDQTPSRAPIRVDSVLAEALTLVSPWLDTRSLAVQTEISPDIPPLLGDETALRQMLVNLLTNAIDATAPAGTITVAATALRDDGSQMAHLELTVRDTGHGMTPEQLRHAREPFYTTKAPGRGTGLGLVIVDHIVRAHGGRLAMESTPEQGTTIRVRLPLEL